MLGTGGGLIDERGELVGFPVPFTRDTEQGVGEGVPVGDCSADVAPVSRQPLGDDLARVLRQRLAAQERGEPFATNCLG
jgi:hypothetical protein